MNNIQKQLKALQEPEYGDFMARLNPTLKRNSILGVRVPKIRKLARELLREDPQAVAKFLANLPHKYYEENLLHSILLSQSKDFDFIVSMLDEFLPYVDNWAVCDTISPKVFNKHKRELLPLVKRWLKSEQEFTCRFAIETLMDFYLNDEDFDIKYLKLVSCVHREQYYVKMAVAWYFATALDKQWDSALPLIEEGVLPLWEHNKTIQKARESRRITDERKQYLNSLKKQKIKE